jgi:CTP:molybdopterin cytidylyltransferase MocA
MNGPTLVILAAGRARRYGGLKQLAPIGMHGEGVIDLIASDAFAAGFNDVVIVINPETGPRIIDHVAQFWPRDHHVSFAIQEKPARHRRRGALRHALSQYHHPFRHLQRRRPLRS